MQQSHTYASQGSKTAFVEVAQRRAETARLLNEAGLAQPGWLARQARSLAGWAVPRLDRRFAGLGEWMAQHGVPVL